jgi:uncharacterized protein
MSLFELIDESAGAKPPEIVFLEGVLRFNGLGLPQDFERAYKCFRAAAESGLIGAQFSAGRMLVEGRGVLPDVEAGVKLLRKAADQDFIPAMLWLALALTGQESASEKFELLHRSATLGAAIPASEVAFAYEDGIGVEQNKTEALRWYKIAAQAGVISACDRLATAYRYGELGLANSESEADFWAAKAIECSAKTERDEYARNLTAANNGHKASQAILAYAYEVGAFGLDVDPIRAAFWKSRSNEALQN